MSSWLSLDFLNKPISIEKLMSDIHEPLFTIQQISHQLDIPKSTLRFWEKELDGFIVPIRTTGGQRRYALKHLSLIGKIKELRKQGMSLTEIKSRLNSKSQDMVKCQQLGNIDLLAERVAAVIKTEIYRFLSDQTPPDLN